MGIHQVNIVPGILIPVGLFIVTLFFVSGGKYENGRIAVSLLFSGFIGFFIFLPFSFYAPYQGAYLMVPAVFFVMFILGAITSYSENVNAITGKKLYKKRIRKLVRDEETRENRIIEIVEEEEEKLKEMQKQPAQESKRLLRAEVLKLEQPVFIYSDISLKYEVDKLDFNMILLSPKGLFVIYHYNWAGEIKFSNAGNARTRIYDEVDVKDEAVLSSYRKQLLKGIVNSLGYENVLVRVLMVLTNPHAEILQRSQFYEVVKLEDFKDYIESDEDFINKTELYDIKSTIDSFIVKD